MKRLADVRKRKPWGASVVGHRAVKAAQKILNKVQRSYHVEPLTSLVRRVLRPAWAPTIEELLSFVELAAERVVHKRKLKAALIQLEAKKEIGSVGRAAHRRYVRITGSGNR